MYMKRNFTILCMCAILLLGTSAHAYAQARGTTCATAIPMGSDYSAQVQNGQSIWYSAWTFDLPLTVTFAPAHGASDPAPLVEMDFSCTTGVYEDSILCSLFCATSGSSGISFDLPHKPQLKSKTLDNGTFVYYLALGKSYRDLLLQVGIDYNVQVYVKVTYKSAGTISLAPDNLFSNCVDGAKFMHFGDTVQVAASDANRHVIVPYVQWQEDTIRYVWNGTTPCRIVIGNSCDFDPSAGDAALSENENVIDFFDLQPGGSKTVSADLLYDYVHNAAYPNEAGMYFAKFYSVAPGTAQVVKVPRALPRGNATLLKYDQTYPLNANDAALFAIPRSWNKDVKFDTPTAHVFKMQIATDPDFQGNHFLGEYMYERVEDGHWRGILGTELVNLWKKTSDQYLYIRFICSEATTVTPSEWVASTCVKSTQTIYIAKMDTTFRITRNSSFRYRATYAQMLGGDLTVSFSSTNTCNVFIATDCNITTSPTAANVLATGSVNSSRSKTFTADNIASWSPRVDEEGYVYFRFNCTYTGTYYITISSTAPEEKDPVYPAMTVSVSCDEAGNAVVRVSEDQHITILQGTTERKSFDAVVGQTYTISDLPAGTYVLRGKNDEIELKL